MGKPDGHPLKDATINQSIGSLITTGLSSNPTPFKGNAASRFDLNPADANLEVHEKKVSTKKTKFNKIEAVSSSAFKYNRHVKVEPDSRRPSPSHDPGLRLSLRSSNKKNKTCKHEDSLFRPQQGPSHGCTSAPKLENDHWSQLILMSCLNCYLHVMVCDDNPKCPKCHKGDCLLDMYRA